jgi:hypothetical protein
MTTPRELGIFLSGLFRTPAYAGINIDRALREAGYRPSFGRGSSARRATGEDAAALLIAFAAAPLFESAIASAADSVEKFVDLPFDDAGMAAKSLVASDLPLLAALPADHSFGMALASLIDTVARGELPARWTCSVGLAAPWPSAEICIFGDRTFGGRYAKPWPTDDQAGFRRWAEGQAREHGLSGMIERRTIRDRTIRDIGELLAGKVT